MPRHSSSLTSDQYTKLRGDHRATYLVIPNPNTVKFAARANQVVFGTSFSSITFDTVTVGAYTDVKVGWKVYLSRTNDITAAYWVGRVRKTPTSTVLYVNRNSIAIQDNDYIFIVRDTFLAEKLPYYNAGTLYVDDDVTYNQLPPIITNLPHAVAGKLATGGNVDFAFAPTALAGTSGRTISSWSWDADGGTFQSGSSSSQNVTIRFTTAGWREIRLTVTDSAGLTNFFAIKTAVYPADYSSVVALDLIPTQLRYEEKLGWTASVDARAGSDAQLLPDTELMIVAEDVFGSTAGSILSNVKFMGRVRRDDTNIQVSLSGNKLQMSSATRLEVEGIGAQMARLILPSMTLRNSASPAEMGEVTNLTLWRGMVFLGSLLTTLSNVVALNFDSTDNTYLYPLFTAQDRSTESSLSDIAFTINAWLNYVPTGQIYVARHMHYLSAADKLTLTTVANWDNRDYTGQISIKRERVDRLGRVIGFAGSYQTAAEDIITLRGKAPAEIWGTGEGRGQMNRQVMAADLTLGEAEDEIELRTGAEYARGNLVTVLDVQHPSGYDNVLQPDVGQFYTWDLDADSNRVGYTCDSSKKWWLQSVTITIYAAEGRTSTNATYIEDISSVNAQVISEQAPDEVAADVGSLPPLLDFPFAFLPSLQYPDGTTIAPEDEQPFTREEVEPARTPPKPSTNTSEPAKPPSQDPASLQGQVVACGDSGSLWLSKNFALSGNPTWRNISPSGSGITAFRFDPYSAGAYCLSNDGTNSYLWRCSNVMASQPDWTATTLSGIWTRIGLAGSGQVYVYSEGTWSHTFDFTSANLWTLVKGSDGVNRGSYSAGYNRLYNHLGTGDSETRIFYNGTFGFTGFAFTYDASAGGNYFIYYDAEPDSGLALGTVSQTAATGALSTGTNQTTSVAVTIASTLGRLRLDLVKTATNSSLTIKSITLSGVGSNPFGGSSSTATRYSNDSGATFGAPVIIGTAPSSAAGMSANLAGSQVVAAMDGKVRTASAGGSFSDGLTLSGSYPIALWGYGATDYLTASAASVSGESLWKNSTAITPNDGSNDGIALGNDAVCTPVEQSLSNIFFAGQFGGSKKLARSANGGTGWNFTTLGSSTNGYVRAKNASQVYLANGSTIAYSEDGGATLVNKPSPVGSTAFVEVR